MKKVAIIGGGVSGLSMAQMLKGRCAITLFEKEKTPGGLIRCRRVNGNLFHTCGGHVFNSKNQNVLDWFWKHFDREKEFVKSERNSVVYLSKKWVPYPIENHVYLLSEEVQRNFINDLLQITIKSKNTFDNFGDFLLNRFGHTLNELYFRPYNEKVWRCDLKQVPLSWLAGKLPMPTVQEMIFNNMNHVEEKQFVHSSFWYEKNNGSQFIADRLSESINIRYQSEVKKLIYDSKLTNWTVVTERSVDNFDLVIFCGNIKQMIKMTEGVDLTSFDSQIDGLKSHGTTTVFCEIDSNPFSWIYQPSQQHRSHRIICTGNFSTTNNAPNKMTGTIEFTDAISHDDIIHDLSLMPLHPKFLDSAYNEYTYPIQGKNTREMLQVLKAYLLDFNLYFSGRFADWEYYNMDAAIEASMKTIGLLEKKL